MDVLLDYRPALRARTGVGEYLHELAAALARTSPAAERLHLFTSSWKDRPEPALRDEVAGARIHDRRVPVRVLNWCWHRAGFPHIEQLIGTRLDVVHAAHPLLIPSRGAAGVVTIHDLEFLERPEWARAEIRRDYAALVRAHADRADGILTSSAHTAARIRERLGVGPDRVVVGRPGPPRWTAGGRSAPRPRRGYLLFVGTLEPRKNLGALLDAYEQLQQTVADVPEMRIAGMATPWAAAWLQRMVRPPLAGRVRHMGYVPDAGRRALFEGASMLVVPSWHEGFGLPALEAMALGVPVVASARGALPEVVGDAGLLVQPDAPGTIAEAIARVLQNDELGDRLAASGAARILEWSWERTAGAVRSLYNSAIEQRNRRHARRG